MGALAIEQIPRVSCGPDEVFIRVESAADCGTNLCTPMVIKKVMNG